jgi:biopolymer transport protein ExbD
MAGGGTLGGNGRRGRGLITEINVTPLVDIMLVLLIIFMVTASYIVRDSLDVKLPEASTGEAQKVSLLAVTIDARGKLGLNGEPTDEKEIRRFIREQRRRGEKVEAVIAADKRVAHGRVVRVIDLVRAEGVTKFAINVLRPER